MGTQSIKNSLPISTFKVLGVISSCQCTQAKPQVGGENVSGCRVLTVEAKVGLTFSTSLQATELDHRGIRTLLP